MNTIRGLYCHYPDLVESEPYGRSLHKAGICFSDCHGPGVFVLRYRLRYLPCSMTLRRNVPLRKAHSLPVCIFPIPPIPCPHCAPLPLKRPHKRRCTESESGIAYRQDNEKRRDCRRCFGLGSSGGITAPPPPPRPCYSVFKELASLKPIVEKLSIDI